MANIAPANFAYVNANGDKGDVQVLSDADITLLNEGLQDIEDLKLAIQKPLPAGTIIPFAGNVVPEGFLICNGAAVSRTTYANLFAAIGTTFGSGDDSTTFALPNLIDKFVQGSTTVGTAVEAGLPNITGTFCIGKTGPNENSFSGSFYSAGDSTTIHGNNAALSARHAPVVGINASLSSSIYGNSSTVQPPALTLLPCIKY